jgi:hypothetical protein
MIPKIQHAALRWSTILGFVLFSMIAMTWVRDAAGSDVELRKAATWKWPTKEELSPKLALYLDSRSREQIDSFWSQLSGDQVGPSVFDHLLATLALSDARLDRVLSQLDRRNGDTPSAIANDLGWLDASWPDWVQSNVRLAIGRALAQYHLYDEALLILNAIDGKLVADPSTLMFYKAICHHHLLQREDCVQTLTHLMERENELVSRYAVTARLMKSDIEPLKEDSLDEISRLMNDVHRRLDLGRSGKIVRDQEQQIVDKLDKMIDKIEEQLQQQQQQQKQQQEKESRGKQDKGQNKPMEDSRIAGGNGPGDVDPKNVGKRSGWGDLPPAQRHEALQNITKDLPSHYREVIEAYFKALATENP